MSPVGAEGATTSFGRCTDPRRMAKREREGGRGYEHEHERASVKREPEKCVSCVFHDVASINKC